MNNMFVIRGAVVLALCLGLLTVHAEDYQLLKFKTELLAEQAQELYQDSCRKGSATYGAAYQYYFSLIHASGTNLLARGESLSNERLMRSYIDLVAKDYEAYTRVSAETDKALATGTLKGHAGARHRAKRLANAEKLGDRELGAAIKRWEKFAGDVKRRAK